MLKKIVLFHILLSVCIYGFSFSEFREICNKDNYIITATSAPQQSESSAIDSAEILAYDKLVSQEFGTTVSSKSFLKRAYNRLNKDETVIEDFKKTIETKAEGLIFPVHPKPTEFFPDGSDAQTGYAKAYIKRNCNSIKAYKKFMEVFSK